MTLQMKIDDEREEARNEGFKAGITRGKAAWLTEGMAKGRSKGELDNKIRCIRNLIKNAGCSATEAMTLLGIPESEHKRLLSMI